ncbi:MAG: amidohydrolase/deacetylase family metallohydrolase [SAR202 cluster bacterium]|nr:amidohydrolase/deacetylase family metallohydrolase [SAR202 cluster bacterium]
MAIKQYDLIVKNGHVIDTYAKVNGKRDVAFVGGKVAAVEESISSDLATETFDATGCIVSPGLIDLHVHAYWGVSGWGIMPDPVHIAKGVTTAVDAGSSGARTFPAFRKFIMEPAQTRLFALLHLSSMGLITDNKIGELMDMQWAEVDQAIACARKNRDMVVGIKIRMGRQMAAENDLEVMNRAKEAAEGFGGFIMMHISNHKTPLAELCSMLRPGDVVTHSFHGFEDGLVEDTGRLREGLLEAQRRGIIFDVGHGGGGFSFFTAENAMRQGLWPDNISTDLHTGSVNGPVHDLLTVMSKFMYLGLSVEDVVHRTTTTAAKILGKSATLGTLKPGAEGDAAIFKVEDGNFTFVDRILDWTKVGNTRWYPGKKVEAKQRLTHVKTVKAGAVYKPYMG